MPEPCGAVPVSALSPGTFQQVGRFAQNSTVSPHEWQWGTKQRSLGVSVLSRRCCQEEWLHLSESKVKPWENREQLCSPQRKEWFSSASRSTIECFRILVCPQKQITRLLFNPESSFGTICMHQARGLQNRSLTEGSKPCFCSSARNLGNRWKKRMRTERNNPNCHANFFFPFFLRERKAPVFVQLQMVGAFPEAGMSKWDPRAAGCCCVCSSGTQQQQFPSLRKRGCAVVLGAQVISSTPVPPSTTYRHHQTELTQNSSITPQPALKTSLAKYLFSYFGTFSFTQFFL